MSALGLGAIDALSVARTANGDDRFVAAGFALAHAAVLGGVVAAWRVLVTRLARARVARVLDVGVAAVVATAVLRVDCTHWATRVARGGAVLPFLAFALAVGCTALLIAIAVGDALARRGRAIPAVAVAAVAAVANHALLPHDYRGVHLFVSTLAILFASEAIARRSPFAGRPRGIALASGATACLALLGVAVAPPTGPLLALLEDSGASSTPYIAEARARLERGAGRPAAVRAVRRATPPTRPGLSLDAPLVVLLTVDCMRADVLRTDRDRLPNFAAFARSSVRFTSAHTAAPATMVAITSMLSGRLYTQQRWSSRPVGAEAMPEPDAGNLPSLLAAGHVDTVVLESSDWMRPDVGVTHGFARSVALPREVASVHARAASVVGALLRDLDSLRGPRFVYAHFLEPHAPYDLGSRAGTDRQRYVSELALVDAAIGALVAGVEARGLASRALIVVTADHGEAFQEHGRRFHGTTLYEEMTQVPLWVRLPTGASRELREPVSALDLAPTILDVFGIATPGSYVGTSLVPVLAGSGSIGTRVIAADSGRLARAMWFSDGFKVILDLPTGASELYDLRHDPRERHNLYVTTGSDRRHRDLMSAWFDRNAPPATGYTPPYRAP